MEQHSGYSDKDHFPFQKDKKTISGDMERLFPAFTKVNWPLMGKVVFLCVLCVALIMIVASPYFLRNVGIYSPANLASDMETVGQASKDMGKVLQKRFGSDSKEGATGAAAIVVKPIGKVMMEQSAHGPAYYFLYADHRIEQVDEETYKTVSLSVPGAQVSDKPAVEDNQEKLLFDVLKRLLHNSGGSSADSR